MNRGWGGTATGTVIMSLAGWGVALGVPEAGVALLTHMDSGPGGSRI